LPLDRPAVRGAFTDEGSDHLQPSGVDALHGGYVECYRKGFFEEGGETLFEGACITDRALGRQGECARRRLLLGGRLAVARV
jgi:hypothetical protein